MARELESTSLEIDDPAAMLASFPIFIGAIIAYFIINAVQKKERKDDEI